MARPVFLVIEVQQPEGLSTRKLVLETAQHNVLTAYSGAEGLEIIQRHPVDAVVVHGQITDVPCGEIVSRVKREQPKTPVIVLAATESFGCADADVVLSSHDPGLLLQKLNEIVGNGAPQTRPPKSRPKRD